MKLCARLQPAGQRESGGGGGRGESSEDEFERDMECELMGLLETLASPDVLAATAASRRGRGVCVYVYMRSISPRICPPPTMEKRS